MALLASPHLASAGERGDAAGNSTDALPQSLVDANVAADAPRDGVDLMSARWRLRLFVALLAPVGRLRRRRLACVREEHRVCRARCVRLAAVSCRLGADRRAKEAEHERPPALWRRRVPPLGGAVPCRNEERHARILGKLDDNHRRRRRPRRHRCALLRDLPRKHRNQRIQLGHLLWRHLACACKVEQVLHVLLRCALVQRRRSWWRRRHRWRGGRHSRSGRWRRLTRRRLRWRPWCRGRRGVGARLRLWRALRTGCGRRGGGGAQGRASGA